MRDRIRKRVGIIFIVVFIILLIPIFLVLAHLHGYERIIYVEKDAYIYDHFPDNNYGDDDYLRVGNYEFGKIQTFYCFNISSLSDGWTEIEIIVNFDYGSSLVDVAANLTYEPWDEMTITWNNKPDKSVYRGHILCDGFDFRIPIRSDQVMNDGVSVVLYGKGGESDGYIQGYSKEGASRKNDIAWIELSYIGIAPEILNGLSMFGIIFSAILGIIGIFILVLLIRENVIFKKPRNIFKRKVFGAEWLNANLNSSSIHRSPPELEKKVNEYITLKLEHGRTFIYVNGRRFIQCIRLILNIPKNDVPLYDEVDSIDEAAKLYSKHIYQNRIVRGPMAAPVPNQWHSITPEQEFWGHCSNIQAWVEHDYDTRILMSNIAFPLLRELTRAGDPLASKIFKEEIALRLESGYPSVVEYLLNQGYIRHFTPDEFKSIISSTRLIKGLSSNRKMLSRFLVACGSKFPTSMEDILIKVLGLPDGKNIIISSMGISETPRFPLLRTYIRSSPQYLLILKNALKNLLREANKKFGKDIIDCIHEIENKLRGQEITFRNSMDYDRMGAIDKLIFDNMVLNNLGDEENVFLSKKLLGEIRSRLSRCPYCGKEIPKGQDTCKWCGHKRDDDEGGFFPHPFIFKPPGGGGLMKEAVVVAVRGKSQT